MTVPTQCKNFCEKLRRMGFAEDLPEPFRTFSEDSMINASVKMIWSDRTCNRYLGTGGLLVKFGYIKVTEEGEYRLTGEDLK